MFTTFGQLKKLTLSCIAAAILFAGAAQIARAQYSIGNYGPGGGEGANAAPNTAIIKAKPNAQIPLDLSFTSSDGTTVKLGEAFDGKPVILTMVYFSCPKLCDGTQEALMAGIQDGPRNLKLGQDYNVVVVSIDPDEPRDAAAQKRKRFLSMINLPENQKGFYYLTGNADNTRALADTIGFGYIRNNDSSEKFSHQAGIFICTPQGKLSQTIGGIQYEPDTLHFRLREAAGGRIGSGMINVALSCGAMTYDAATGTYRHNGYFWMGTGVGIVTLVTLGTFLFVMWRGEYRKSKLNQKPSGPAGPTITPA